MGIYVSGSEQKATMEGRARLIERVTDSIGTTSVGTSTTEDKEMATVIVDDLLAVGLINPEYFAEVSDG